MFSLNPNIPEDKIKKAVRIKLSKLANDGVIEVEEAEIRSKGNTYYIKK